MLEYLKSQCGRLILLDPEPICAACGSPKVLNTALLGAAAASGALGLSLEEVQQAMEKRIPQKLLSLNEKALSLGAKAGKMEN